MTLLGEQQDIRPSAPMPVSDTDSSVVLPITGETAVFYYNNAGVLTVATGQVSGTVIYAKLAYDGILNSLSSTVGTANDTSFAFVTGTVLATKTDNPGEFAISDFYAKTLAQKFTFIAANLSAGQFFIDHVNGAIWGVAAAVVASDTCSYKVKTGSISVTINAGDIEIGAVELKDATTDSRAVINAANTPRAATDNVVVVQNIDASGRVVGSSFAEDTAHASGDLGTEILAVRRDAATSSSGNDGDYSTINTDALGKLWTRPDGGSASGASDGGNPVKVGGRYNATPPTLSDGNRGDMQLDSAGNVKETLGTLLAGEDASNNLLAVMHRPIASTTYAWLSDNSYGTVTKKAVKATAGNVYSISAHNDNAAVRYLQIHNKATVAAGTDVPVWSIAIPPAIGGTPGFANITAEDLGLAGYALSLGFSWAISTTRNTFTDSATASEHTIFAQYV